MFGTYFKRLIDIILVLLLLPPFLTLSLLIGLVSVPVFRGQVFFVQKRIGYRNKTFQIYKFTTLRKEQKGGKTLPLEERQTAWGKFLRDYSLDELPQLLNILKGEMSFVGPRPLLPEYLPLYNSTEVLRHLAKPGLTGLAQVKGRNSLSWSRKMACDIYYIRNQSVLLDLKILFKTILVLWRGQVVNHGKAPNFEFKWVKV